MNLNKTFILLKFGSGFWSWYKSCIDNIILSDFSLILLINLDGGIIIKIYFLEQFHKKCTYFLVLKFYKNRYIYQQKIFIYWLK